MNKTRIFATSMLAAACFVGHAHAFGNLGNALGGGAKPAGEAANPAAIEKDLKLIIVSTSQAVGKLSEAMGLKTEADRMLKNAECVQSNACGVKEAVETVDGVSASVAKAIEAKRGSGVKLDGDAARTASSAILPGIQSMVLWKRVIDGGKALSQDRMAAMRSVALLQAMPVVPAAAKGSADFFVRSVDYLSFSGVDTKEMKSEMDKGIKSMGL